MYSDSTTRSPRVSGAGPPWPEYLDAERCSPRPRRVSAATTRTSGAEPFDKYDQLFVPEFNAGAMENAGAVTFQEGYVFRSKITRASTSGVPRRSCTRWRTCGSGI